MDSDSIKCTQCSKSFEKKAKLTAHMKTVHSGIKYECDFCEKQYNSKQGLTAHKKSIHKEELHNSETKETEEKVVVSNNLQSSRSQNTEVAASLKASSTKTDDQVDSAMKSNVAKKVTVYKEKKSAKKDPKIKEKQKLSDKGVKKKTVSLISNLKNDNELNVSDKHDNLMEKEILNKVNPKIKFDFTPLESQNRIEIKAKGDVSKENLSHLLKDQPNHVKFSSFASDCKINHEDCQDKHINKPNEMVQTEVEDDDKESCLWAHCDNLLVEEELEFTKASAVNTQEIPPGNTAMADDHSEEKVPELHASKGNNLKHSEGGFNVSVKPSQSVEPQNVTEKYGISLESSLVLKKDDKTAVSLETTPEVANTVVEEFVCETVGCKKKFTAKGDLDEHMRTADGQNRKCPLCLKDFFNEECRKYHKDQNCGVDSESDEEGDEDDDSDFDEEAEGEEDWDEDEILDGPEHEMEGLSNEPEKVQDMDNKLDVYDNVKETDVDRQIVLKPLDQRKPDKLVSNKNEINEDLNKDKTDKERNDTLDKVEANSKLLVNSGVQCSENNVIPTATQHSTIDGMQIEDVSRPTNAFSQSSPSYVQPKSDSQAPTQYAKHLTKAGIQPLTNYAQIPSKDTNETQQNNVQYPIENATKMPTNDVQRHTINVNQKSANDISHPTQNDNQGPANDAKHRIGNGKSVNDVKYPTENVSEASSTDIEHPSGANIKQTIRPLIEVEDRNKAPERTFSLKEKQLLYRFYQARNQYTYLKSIPYSPEQLIQMSQEHFDNISVNFIPPQLQFCKDIRQKFLKVPSKPAPSNILQEKQSNDNSMQNETIPKQMLKRKGELVNNESMSKKIHLESKAAKEEFEDPNLKIQLSVSKGLNLGNNKDNYEVIIEDGKVKLRIIGNHSSSESLDEDNDEGSGQDNSKWKTSSDYKKDRSFSNGGPTIPEGWKICFKEQRTEGRKVMVANYRDPQGKFYNRGPNGYDQIPKFQ